MALLELKKLLKGMKDDAVVESDIKKRIGSMRLLEFEKLTVGDLKKLLKGMKDDALVIMELENWSGRPESRYITAAVVRENSIKFSS